MSQLEKPAPERNQLQALLELHGLSNSIKPLQPWNIRESSPKFAASPQTVTIKSTELQKLLESNPQLKPIIPEQVWNIRSHPETVTLKTTDLQKLLEASESLKPAVPASTWSIRHQEPLGSTPAPAPGTVAVRTTDLQRLLESSGALDTAAPDAVWNIRGNPETVTIRTNDLQQLFELSGLSKGDIPAQIWNIRESAANSSSRPQPNRISNTDLQNLLRQSGALKPVVPENVWDIRSSSPRFRGTGASDSKPSVPEDGRSRAKEIQLTELQKLLSTHGLKETSPENPWNIRDSSPRFRQLPESEDVELLDPTKNAEGEVENLTHDLDLGEILNNKPERINLSDLQKLFQENGLNGGPQVNNAWNIRESGENYREVKFLNVAEN